MGKEMHKRDKQGRQGEGSSQYFLLLTEIVSQKCTYWLKYFLFQKRHFLTEIVYQKCTYWLKYFMQKKIIYDVTQDVIDMSICHMYG